MEARLPDKEVIKDQKLDLDYGMSEQAERPLLLFSIVESSQLLAEMKAVINQSRKLLHQPRIEGEHRRKKKDGFHFAVRRQGLMRILDPEESAPGCPLITHASAID
jgi:hypothetical protein